MPIIDFQLFKPNLDNTIFTHSKLIASISPSCLICLTLPWPPSPKLDRKYLNGPNLTGPVLPVLPVLLFEIKSGIKFAKFLRLFGRLTLILINQWFRAHQLFVGKFMLIPPYTTIYYIYIHSGYVYILNMYKEYMYVIKVLQIFSIKINKFAKFI